MGFSDDSDNDLPDWLSEFGPEDDDQSDRNREDPSDQLNAPEGDQEEPDWLKDIREQKDVREDASTFLGGRGGNQDEDDEEAWLENIREQYKASDTEGLEVEGDDEDDQEDFIEKIRALKAEEEDDFEEEPEEEGFEQERPLSDEEPTIRLQDWTSAEQPPSEPDEEPPGLVEEPGREIEEEQPDWVSGLPDMDFEESNQDSPAFFDQQADEDDDDTPSWLSGVEDHVVEEPALEIPPDEVLSVEEPAEEEPAGQEPDEDTPQSSAFTEDPKVTGSLPTWMETLQTSGLVLPQEAGQEEELEGAGYSEEEITTLFEQDDLPDWLGPAEGETGADQAEPGEETAPTEVQPEREIERGELPNWLRAIRPVEAVTSAVEEEEEAEEAVDEPEKERVGPLSGLSDVLPAEPHIVHFGTPPHAALGFELTDIQKEYTQLLKSMVEREQAVTPPTRRSVANPQQILRWIIAVLLLAVTIGALWLGNSFTLARPDPVGMPPENLAVVSLVNELGPEDRVLLAFEYQPGLSGELEAASSALVQHLLLQQAQLVLVSTQPVGPGLGEAFLKEHFSGVSYINQGGYANLGYVSGGSAGLLGLAGDIRQGGSDHPWDQPPLDAIQSIRDFSLVLVLTDDPDVARSWIEQVGPALDLDGTGQGIPLAMVVSAQAEPLVYPYYSASPRQISGLVSGVTGGAYYENVVGSSTASGFWTAYNAGLMVAVIIIAVGSIFNLARNSLQGFGKGRS